MNNIIPYLLHFSVIFSSLLTFYYLVPVTIWYYIAFVYKKEHWKELRIQKTYPTNDNIVREIKYSIISILIFSIIGEVMYEAILTDNTAMYFNFQDHSIWYLVLSFFIAIAINDTLFYWFHRLMHWNKIFKYVHLVHHKSKNPTPFASFSFQPLDALLNALPYPIIVFFVPIHPIVFFIFLVYNLITNLAAHSGLEFLPSNNQDSKFYKWMNTVSNHDLHHTDVNYNYGNYFSFWDIVMKTYKKPTSIK